MMRDGEEDDTMVMMMVVVMGIDAGAVVVDQSFLCMWRSIVPPKREVMTQTRLALCHQIVL